MERINGSEPLPGFRFHPTEEELLDFYLKQVVYGKKLPVQIIGTLNLYLYDPWDLPGFATVGEREWYFFVPRDRRHANGGRPNRTTEKGFWKATGSDRPIRSVRDPKRLLGLKKTLVFYRGRAPKGTKTDWVMNEYRLPENASIPMEDIVLCKIYRKATSLKELEQRAAMEEDIKGFTQIETCTAALETVSSSDQENYQKCGAVDCGDPAESSTGEAQKDVEVSSTCVRSLISLPELQVPKHSWEWMQEPFLTQLRSPWLDQWSPYANILNF